MKARLLLVHLMSLSLALTPGLSVYAESAPVYDADTMDQPGDQVNNAQGGDMPPPPPASMGPEASNEANDTLPDAQDDVFAPFQPPQQSQAEVSAPPASAPPAPRQYAQANDDMPPPSPPEQPKSSVTNMPSMEGRLRHLEQVVENIQTNGGSSDANPQLVESFRNEIQALKMQVDQLNAQLAQIQNQQKIPKPAQPQLAAQQPPQPQPSAANNVANMVSAKPIRSESSQPDVAQEQQIYQEAYNLIKAKKYNEAVNILQSMLQKYPSGQFASNAHYWLGELYGLMGKNDKALSEFNLVVSNYPQSPRVSDAMLKVGLIFAAQAKWRDAKNVFHKVINRYPGTASSRLANDQLKQIRQAGH